MATVRSNAVNAAVEVVSNDGNNDRILAQAIVPVSATGVAVAVDSTGGVTTIAKPSSSGGLTMFRVVTGATGFIKASAGQMYTMTVYNANAAVRYLHLYNKASAPTLSTDTPVMTFPILGASIRDIAITDTLGAAFSVGIAWAYTTDDIAIPTAPATAGELHFSGCYR